jgi:hypothetical protein
MIDAQQALQAMLQPAGLQGTLFPPTSRYHGIETVQLQAIDGHTVVYLKRRLLPPPEHFALLQEHVVTEGERLDTITAQYVGDPEQFWQICDANRAMQPDELTATPGRRLRITLPEGIPGAPHA